MLAAGIVRLVRIAPLLAALLCAPPAARAASGATTVTVNAARDATLYSQSGAVANGAGSYLFTGITDDGFLRHALVAFDVAAAVPAGATITNVTLTLTLSRTRTQDLAVELHRVTAAWGEGTSNAGAEEGMGTAATSGDATWTHRFYPTTTWSSPGGDFAAAASATLAVGNQNGPYPFTGAGLVADVQAWLDGAAPNHGWIVLAQASANKETKRFNSHENVDPATRPLLAITFTTPTSNGACCATSGVCSIVVSPGSACTGAYQGNGSTCSPNPCPPPSGACCFANASATCTTVTDASCVTSGGTFRGAGSACSAGVCPVVLTPFVDRLPSPKVATPTSGVPGGAAEYTLSLVERSQKLHRDLPATRVWGFDDGSGGGGTYPGPTIEAYRDAPVSVTWRNDLRDASGALRTAHLLPVDTCLQGATTGPPRTVIHLHGGHVAAASDGYPEATIVPGQSVAFDYPNWQQAATLWYHDHAMGVTRLNVYLGLAGFYLLRDAVESGLGLPSGDHEIPLAIQDRTFRPDGSLAYPATWDEHVFGDTILVNGAVWPFLDVDRGKYRLRLLNGSGSRTYRLQLSTCARMHVIGSDTGLLAAPVPVSSVLLTPGERADVVVDFEECIAGTEVLLENDAPAPFPGTPGVGVVPHVMKFVVGPASSHTAPLPATLRPVAPLDPAGAAAARDFVLDKLSGDPCTGSVFRINGLGWDAVTEHPVLGTTEIWRFVNATGSVHPMHMHLVAFQVLDRQPITVSGGGWVAAGPAMAPAPVEAGWKDTVAVGANEAVRVIARFEDFVGLFPYHCHILEHEDHEMMRQFETTTVCGDGVRGIPAEECDDGNTLAGDGCSGTCTRELVDAPDLPGATEAAGCGCGAGGGLDLGALAVAAIALLRRRWKAPDPHG